MVITMRHVRQAGLCSRGVRAFFTRHRLDWQVFLRNGIAEETVLATKDAMALRVVEVARAET